MRLQLVTLQLLFVDGRHVIVDANEHGRSHEYVERKRVDADAVVEEVLRRVDVRAGMRAER